MQIVAYFDELEVCNPLGAHVKKHKLGIVFYTLGNIAPMYKVTAQSLAVVATVPTIEKHGLDKVLEPFLTDLNSLANMGISVSVHGVPRIFKGALLAFLADNLASNDIGGFKKSFSFSFRFCRTCLTTRDRFSSAFTSEQFELRTDSNHRTQCGMLEGPIANHYSTTYGINRKSSLLNVKHFSMFGGGLPHDAMHDIFEGIAPHEIKLLLSQCISDHLFTLKEFNTWLINFNYGYSETDRPVPILSRVLNSDQSIRASSSEMLLLVRKLPFILGHRIPKENEYWHCFLLLKKIIDIVLCPLMSEGSLSSLKLLIKEHHSKFVSNYGSKAFIPKMHFLVHYPDQIHAVGPMIRTWTICHEAKLNFFKQASRLSNFKNIALSVASRPERWMCYELSAGKFIHTSLDCGPAVHGSGCTFVKDETSDIKDALARIIPQLNPEATVFRPRWIRRNVYSLYISPRPSLHA